MQDLKMTTSLSKQSHGHKDRKSLHECRNFFTNPEISSRCFEGSKNHFIVVKDVTVSSVLPKSQYDMGQSLQTG